MLNISYNKDGIFDFLICPSPFLGEKKKVLPIFYSTQWIILNWHLLKLFFHLNEKGHVANVRSAAEKSITFKNRYEVQ
jgi:hypothetical protein